MDEHCPHCDDTTPHMQEKLCTECQDMVPHTLMAKEARSKDGYRSVCKAHWAAYMKTQYDADKPAWHKRAGAYKKAYREQITQQETARRRELVADPVLGPQIRERAAKTTAKWRGANPEK